MRTIDRNFVILIIIFVMIVQLGFFVSAVDDLMALQGNVLEGGVNLQNGNLTVHIFDAPSGGNLIYNSTDDFQDAISNGEYDVMLGNVTQNLTLNYGEFYYLEMYVNGEPFTFNGATRQIFQSSVGNITSLHINWTDSINLPTGKNFTTSSGGWFKGLFNWVVDSVSTNYFSFNGSTLTFNETHLNSTISGFGNLSYLKLTGGIVTGQLNVSSGGMAITGDVDFNGGWTSNGVTISNDDVFLGTLYAYNITSLGINNLDINGSLLPIAFNNTFDVGNLTWQWRNGYFGTDVFISGDSVKQWMYNQSLATSTMWNDTWSSTFNATYDVNETLATFTLYNATWDNRNLVGLNHTSVTFGL